MFELEKWMFVGINLPAIGLSQTIDLLLLLFGHAWQEDIQVENSNESNAS